MVENPLPRMIVKNLHLSHNCLLRKYYFISHFSPPKSPQYLSLCFEQQNCGGRLVSEAYNMQAFLMGRLSSELNRGAGDARITGRIITM
ncbi:hypothetical protein Peur_050179 [Populus x canadensis]